MTIVGRIIGNRYLLYEIKHNLIEIGIGVTSIDTQGAELDRATASYDERRHQPRKPGQSKPGARATGEIDGA